MKKGIFFVIVFIILNGCTQYSALTGPTYTMVKSGSILKAGSSYVASYGIEKTLGQSPSEYINSLVKKNHKIDSFLNQKKVKKNYKINSLLVQKESITECQKMHTSNKVFLDTLDQINCLRDPFSIFK